MSIRTAKLNGTRAATELHAQLGLAEKITSGDISRVDVFEALHNLSIPTLCRPLDGILGAFLNTPAEKGVLVTTKRRLPIQRFTAAHELGHCFMNHKDSIDSEQSLSEVHAGIRDVPLQEIEAEAFASEFLLPKALLIRNAQKQGWKKKNLSDPNNVYQLSLRTGTSYEATWRALLENDLISNEIAHTLQKSRPKDAKRSLVSEGIITNSWSDVVGLTSHDQNSRLELGQEDTVVLSLPEHTTSGYAWSSLAEVQGVSLIDDSHSTPSRDMIGGKCRRSLIFQGTGSVQIEMFEKRPWEKTKEPLNSFRVQLEFQGQENGLPRVTRQ